MKFIDRCKSGEFKGIKPMDPVEYKKQKPQERVDVLPPQKSYVTEEYIRLHRLPF